MTFLIVFISLSLSFAMDINSRMDVPIEESRVEDIEEVKNIVITDVEVNEGE